MKKNFKLGTLAQIAVYMMLLVTASYAQGTLKGVVRDTEAGTPLVGVYVTVESLSKGTATDENGSYTLELPAGTHTVVVSSVGFKSISNSVSIQSGQESVLDFNLEADQFNLSEVVVTATNTPRTLAESPLSLTRLGSTELMKLSANGPADILRAVPGITAEGGGGEAATNVFIRGLPSGGQYQFTPLQIDGMPILSTFGLNSSAHDVYFRTDIGIENLEFVRGGVSTLYGAGSVAGIINFTSKTGNVKPENIVQMEYGTGGRVKTDFYTSGTLSEQSKTFYAFSGFYRYDEGPLKTGLPTEGTQIRGNIKKVFDDGSGEFVVSGQFIDDKVQFYLPYPLDGASKNRVEGNDGETVNTVQTNQAADLTYRTPNGVYQSPIRDGVATKGGFLMVRLDKDLNNNFAFSGKVKYARYAHQFNFFLDGDGVVNTPETLGDYLAKRGLPRADSATFKYSDTGEILPANAILFANRVQDRNRPMNELVGEFKVTKTTEGTIKHSITAGTFLSRTEAGDFNVTTQYLADFRSQPRLVDLSYIARVTGQTMTYSLNGLTGPSVGYTNRYLASSKVAGYLTDEIKSDKWTMDIGLRWERAIGDYNAEGSASYVTETSATLSNNLKSVRWGNGDWLRSRVSDTEMAVAGAFMYKMNKSLNTYINFSSGYFFPELRSLKFTPTGTPQTYEGERINQTEVGAKFATSKLLASAAAYAVELKGRRAVDFVNDGSGGTIENVSIQDALTIGIEGNVAYYIIPQLSVTANVTYQKHELTKDEAKPEFEGNWLRRQPRVLANMGVTYAAKGIDASFNNTYTGRKFTGDDNTIELDANNIVRVDLGYTLALEESKSLRIGIAVYNLFDEEAIAEGSPRQGGIQQVGQYFVGRPSLPRRTFVRATFKF